jgi:hypothetical protein
VISQTDRKIPCGRVSANGGNGVIYMARDPDLGRVRSDPGVQEALALARQKHEEFKKKWSGMLP